MTRNQRKALGRIRRREAARLEAAAEYAACQRMRDAVRWHRYLSRIMAAFPGKATHREGGTNPARWAESLSRWDRARMEEAWQDASDFDDYLANCLPQLVAFFAGDVEASPAWEGKDEDDEDDEDDDGE